MGNDAKKKADEEQRRRTIDMTSRMVNEQAFKPSPLEGEASNFFNRANENAQGANDQARADYGNIMGNYQDLFANAPAPTTFSWNNVSSERPAELGEAYGTLRNAGRGYQEFADTGGYSPQDVRELRARGMAPIRAAYSNTVRELDRANTLGGGAANYIAARSNAQRELPQQTADAMTGVNAELANSIRQGRLAGLGGLTSVGGTMGGLSSNEAERILRANLANSQGNLQAAGMTEASGQNYFGNRMGALGAQANLYGTTPGMANMFGQQALSSLGQRGQLEANRNNVGLGLIDANLNALGQKPKGRDWWQTALSVAGTAAPYVAMAMSDKNVKEDISKPLDHKKIMSGIKKLNISTWKYKGDDVKHMGPMAQDVKKHLGIGDGKTLHLADIMGVMLATAKSEARA